ncbi:S8 family serine peptidase [Ferrimonas balearica]|uniref:S8 family serine peptidase n=1 Tax=Ferrimonas balearica TaxID=44012 RepID=UPI002D806BBE|nr:S8 family serine peptidase [Ferrimonas balearica]MBY6096027.1 S8 family serine peptidase [Ferrimonas balearica]
MKKQLALAIAAACYSAGALAAVQTGPQGYTPLKAATISDKASRTKHAPLAIERFQANPNDDGGVHRYIIQLASPALPNYKGGISGLTATNIKANRGNALTGQDGKQRLNVRSQASLDYRAHLMDEQQRFISKASRTLGGNFNVLAQTQLALNGMIVEGTQAEMMKLAKLMDVRSITLDKRHELHTDRGPGWIGADKVWDGTVTGVDYKGEGLVVGILDTGVDTNSRSFAATGDDGYTHTNPYGDGVYKGDCLTDASLCNAKLVGVYSWPEITDLYEGAAPANGQDYNGHGSHTAGTTAGNVLYNVPVLDADGKPGSFSFDQISGVAPHANVISFQTCLPGESSDPLSGCLTSLAVLSVEAAIADNVSVLNYSVGGRSSNPWNDSESIAFLNARAAGIHVATSAGNSGPGPATVGSPGDNPWLTSVGAFTHDRDYIEKSLTLAGGDSAAPTGISGKSITGALAATPLVYAGDFTNANDPDNDPAQCLQPFPEGTFNGEIVICDRGEIARVAKGQNVAAGGAGGLILANLQDGADSVVADPHVIPALHVDANDGDALKAWLTTGDGHTAAIPATTVGSNPNAADIAADFTSRGPNPSIPDVLVPHVAAPGVSIYAAYAPTTPFKGSPNGAEFAFLSGTSMASPHVAGALALIAGTRPDWTPAEAQSALMLTATQTAWKEDGSTRADFFDMGAGRIQIDKAINSPLVLDESRDDYLAADPSQGGDPSQINMAALAKGECIGSCSWTRTVKATQGGSFTAQGVALDSGMILTVEPASFTLAAGESQTLQIAADVMNAKRNDWNMGNIELSNGSETLRMPVVAFASTGNLPDQVAITAHRDADSILLPDMTAVAITDFTVTSYGLTKADLTEGSLMADSDLTSPFDDTTDGVEVQLLTVGEGNKRMVAEILTSTSPDLDLFVGIDTNGDGLAQEEELLAYSATASAMEKVDLTAPQAGDYWILVQNYTASVEGGSDSYTLATALVDGTTADNLTVEGPSAVGALETFDLRILWNDDMMTGDVFYGAVELGTDANDEANLGMMRVDLVRGEDDVTLTSNLEDGARVSAGAPVRFTVNVMPNLSYADRNYDISIAVPDSIIIDESSLPEGATLNGGTLTLSTVLMPSLAGLPLYSYAMTNNTNDASCVMPDFGQGSGYVDLEALIGEKTNPDLSGDGVLWGWDRGHEFLGEQYDTLYFGDDGFITFSNETGDEPDTNQALPDMADPNNLLAFLWRDGVVVYDEASNSGVTLASAGDISLIEFDNLVSYYQFTNAAAADMMDVQVLLMPSAGEGPEIIVAFDNVVHDYGSILGATVGYEDATGSTGEMMIYHAFNNPEGAIGNMTTEIQDGTLFCFDQQLNLESTMFDFIGTVAEDFAGGPISMVLTSETDADGTQPESNESAGTVEVEGAPVVTIAGSKNATLTANERATVTLAGEATDPNGDALTLIWTQIGGPAATLSGANTAQARVELPAVEGRTELVFQLTASDDRSDDRANITVTVNNTDDDDGGSLGWLVLLLAPLAAMRRRSH